jgi:hypothetical protein
VLDEQTLKNWTEIGATIVPIGVAEFCSGERWLLDEDQELGNWINEEGASVLLVRPDRFCMAFSEPKAASDRLGRAYRLLTT